MSKLAFLGETSGTFTTSVRFHVTNAFCTNTVLVFIREFILERNLINVVSVTNAVTTNTVLVARSLHL